jgi:hypothetical protein
VLLLENRRCKLFMATANQLRPCAPDAALKRTIQARRPLWWQVMLALRRVRLAGQRGAMA